MLNIAYVMNKNMVINILHPVEFNFFQIANMTVTNTVGSLLKRQEKHVQGHSPARYVTC